MPPCPTLLIQNTLLTWPSPLLCMMLLLRRPTWSMHLARTHAALSLAHSLPQLQTAR
jgi:hypothetical protein